MRPTLFCIDSVILYDDVCGRSYKAEYLVQGDDVILKDFYEIKFVRAEKGSENEMEMNEAKKAELEEEESKLKAEEEDNSVVNSNASAENSVVAEGEGAESSNEGSGTESAADPAPEENVIGTEPDEGERIASEAEATVEVAEDLPLVEEDRENQEDRDDRQVLHDVVQVVVDQRGERIERSVQDVRVDRRRLERLLVLDRRVVQHVAVVLGHVQLARMVEAVD